jgi:hypothetical protein
VHHLCFRAQLEQTNGVPSAGRDASLQKTPAEEGTPDALTWALVKTTYRHILDKMAAEFEKGITQVQLQNPDYTKYRHRRGLNSFLSENYSCKFTYDGQEWASAQLAYQVLILFVLC